MKPLHELYKDALNNYDAYVADGVYRNSRNALCYYLEHNSIDISESIALKNDFKKRHPIKYIYHIDFWIKFRTISIVGYWWSQNSKGDKKRKAYLEFLVKKTTPKK